MIGWRRGIPVSVGRQHHGFEAFRDGGAFLRIADEPGRRRLEIPCPGSKERKMEKLSDEPRYWLMVEKEIASGRRLVRFSSVKWIWANGRRPDEARRGSSYQALPESADKAIFELRLHDGRGQRALYANKLFHHRPCLRWRPAWKSRLPTTPGNLRRSCRPIARAASCGGGDYHTPITV